MAKFLIIGEGISLAHVSRPMLVARELQQSGHEVVFATGPKYVDWITPRGFTPEAIWTPDPTQVYDRLRNLKPMLTTDEVEQSALADLRLIEEHQPDVVIGDCRNSLRISSGLAGVPYVAITNANCTPWYSGPLAIPIKACPNHRLRGLFERALPRQLLAFSHTVGCRKMAKPFAEAARAMGSKADCSDFRLVFTSDDLTLLADAEWFNPVANAPEHVKYCGPLWIQDDPIAAPATKAALARLDNRPLVVLSTGSTGETDRIPGLIQALGEAGFNICLLGSAARLPVEESLHLIKLPFGAPEVLIPNCAAVICHGGNGSIYQAMYHNKPVFSLPSFFDQQTQSQLVEHSNTGKDLLTATVERSVRLIRKRTRAPLTRIHTHLGFRTAEFNAAKAIDQITFKHGASRKQAA